MATHSEPSGAVVIGGLGMVASLGLDAATVCAAARAGLMRSRTLENYRLRSAVEGDEEPVIGHPVTMLTAVSRVAPARCASCKARSPIC